MSGIEVLGAMAAIVLIAAAGTVAALSAALFFEYPAISGVLLFVVIFPTVFALVSNRAVRRHHAKILKAREGMK